MYRTSDKITGVFLMTRLVRHDANGPEEIKPSDKSVWICMCGLSTNKPFCSGAHKAILAEKPGKLYFYENEKQKEIKDVQDV